MNFTVTYLKEVEQFFDRQPVKAVEKMLYNIEKAQHVTDAELFKKITDDIWEFRTEHNRIQYRLLAFWVKRKGEMALVVCASGFVKKSQKTPAKEIRKAEKIREEYLKYELQ